MRQGCRYQSKGSNCRNCGLTKEWRLDQGSTFRREMSRCQVPFGGSLLQGQCKEAIGSTYSPLRAKPCRWCLPRTAYIRRRRRHLVQTLPVAPLTEVEWKKSPSLAFIFLREFITLSSFMQAAGPWSSRSCQRRLLSLPWVRRDAHPDEERPASSAARLTTCLSPPEPQADVGNLL